MAVEQMAAAHYRRRVALARRVAKELGRLWSRVDRQAIGPSWVQLLPAAFVELATGQSVAAAASSVYVDDVAGELGLRERPAGRLQPASLAGVASDGRDLAGLLYQPAITALTAIQKGETVPRALAGGRLSLDMIARTQIADAGRVADGVAVAARPELTGYVRMLVGKSCSRCIVLAGNRYRWNAGFNRHPRCDCVHVPAREDTADDIRTDPMAHFNSLSEADQDKALTKAGAQAIRDGADISQVVNARRGALGLTPAGARITAAEAKALRNGLERGHLQTRDVFGHQLFTTTEGVTTRGQAGIRLGAKQTGEKAGGRYRSAKPPRLMPESIYQIAGDDRDEAVRLLRRFGYIR